MTLATKTERDEACAFLAERISAGDTLWTNVTHVARSGMSRRISVYLIRDNEPWNISGYVAKALGLRLNRDDLAVHVSGCGMDMGFHVVYELSHALFNDGYAINQRWL